MPKKKNKSSNNGHKKFSPSKSKRWLSCPGSVQLSEQCPTPPTSAYAAEGTAAHKLAEMCLENEVEARHYLGQIVEKFDVTEEMADAVQVYLDVIEDDWNEASNKAEFFVEHKVDMSSIHEDLGGTSDAVIDQPRKLTMYDYKHGKGLDVDAEENTQGLNYLLGYAESSEHNYKEFEFVIVQPRLDDEDRHVKRWSCKPGYLKKFKKEVLEAIQKAGYEQPDYAEGDWCRFCPGAGICPKLHNAVMEVAQDDFVPVPDIDLMAPQDLAPQQLLLVLDNAKLIDGWLKSVETYAFGLLERGEQVPGFKLVRGRSQRKWKTDKKGNVSKSALGKLKKLLDEDELYTDPKLKSPAQVEKLIEDKSSIEKLWEKGEGKLTIAPESDKRPAAPPPAVADFTEYDD